MSETIPVLKSDLEYVISAASTIGRLLALEAEADERPGVLMNLLQNTIEALSSNARLLEESSILREEAGDEVTRVINDARQIEEEFMCVFKTFSRCRQFPPLLAKQIAAILSKYCPPDATPDNPTVPA